MIENSILEWGVQNSFAIGVAIYLLYERGKINERIIAELGRVTLIFDRIEKTLDRVEKKL